MASRFISRLQRLSVDTFGALAIFRARVRVWLRARPRVAAWIWADRREPPAADGYRHYNSWIFDHFGEQERMLADPARMAFYHAMVQRHVRPGDQVIDLGTGTGILAAFASRAGAARVHALDHSGIIEEARTLAAHNGIGNVRFVGTHSSAFSLDQPVDVILHEQMGDILFDEDMVPNVLDLRDRLLKPGGRILPSRFELYCEPVKLVDRRAVPFLWELNVYGFDYSPMAEKRPPDADYYYIRSDDPSLVDHFLCEPAPILSIDLETLEQNQLPLQLSFNCTVVRAGRMDGYAVYFRALVDDDLTLSTSPLEPGRAPHWGYRILRTEQTYHEIGDEIEILLTSDDWANLDSWRWE